MGIFACLQLYFAQNVSVSSSNDYIEKFTLNATVNCFFLNNLVSATPTRCQSATTYPCYCYYYLKEEANVYNCSSSSVNELTPAVPVGTDWLVMENNQISELAGNFDYLDGIWSLDLQRNKIEMISESFIKQLQIGGKLEWLNLAHNNLHRIPSDIQNVQFLKKIWLSYNRFHCDCNMIWMIEWLNNFTTPSGEQIIVDYENIKCHSGMMVGMPIYKLDKIIMGCFPPKLNLRQKTAIGIAAGMAGIIIITLIALVIKRSRDVKFFFYYYFKWCTCFGPKEDKNENLDNIQNDAFLSYRLVLDNAGCSVEQMKKEY